MSKLKIGCVRVGFACLGAFAALDFVLALSSPEYRNALGMVRGIFDVAWRFAPNLSMIAFYGIVYVKMREGAILPRVMLWHGLIYGLLGLVLCLPWTYVLAPLTPIGVLYLEIFFETPFGWPGAQGVAATFVVFNIYLIWAGLTSTSSMVSSPRVS